ncbi:MAG: helix-turn-helix domain-containing protein [Christensenellales bacterium]|jgi:two-component system response regulator YesN
MRGTKTKKLLYSMIFSYTVVILVITTIIAMVAIVLSRDVIYSEIGKFDERILESSSEKVFNSVVAKGQSIYLDIILAQENKELISSKHISKDHVAIFELYNILKSATAKHSDSIAAIHIYFNEKNIMVSSNYGYKEFDTRRFDGDYAWLGGLLSDQCSDHCSVPVSYAEGGSWQNHIALRYTYPLGVSLDRARYTVFVIFEEEKIYSELLESFSAGYNSAFLVNGNGVVLSSLNRMFIFEPAPENTISLIDREKDYGQHQYQQDGSDFIFSYYSVKGTDWYIANTLSIHEFYSSYFTMRFYFLLIWLLVLFVGIQMAIVISRLYYKPIQKISLKAIESFGSEIHDRRNEFNIIEGAIDQMHLKISNLQDIIKANSTLMKQNFLLSLLTGRKKDEKELADRLTLFSLPTDYDCAVCFLLDLNNAAMRSIKLDEIQVVKIGLIESLNAASPEWFCIAGEYTDDQVVGVIAFKESERERAFAHISSISQSMFLRLTTGGDVPSLALLGESCGQAAIAAQYSFFYHDSLAIHWSDIAGRHNSDLTLPAEKLSFLGAKSFQKTDLMLDGFCSVLDEIASGSYNVDYSKEIIRSMLHDISINLNSSANTKADDFRSDFDEALDAADSINYLRDWVVDYFCGLNNCKTDTTSQSIISKVKGYINRNLDGDLSLDTVAGHVYMSPKYLSRVFKDITGQNFSEYITQMRIEAACNLLRETRLSVEEITARVGYNSSAYFIMRFKQSVGCTPKQYRRRL